MVCWNTTGAVSLYFPLGEVTCTRIACRVKANARIPCFTRWLEKIEYKEFLDRRRTLIAAVIRFMLGGAVCLSGQAPVWMWRR
ncbi:MAG: hypothetical protein KME29_14675 [Calothrix sp. FI2-JRJ7]|nr:hypothetical protein [Calothrix sp. FI2-JRJ7]